MRLLVTGASGLLGSKITELATKRNHKVYSAYVTHEPAHGTPIKLDILDKSNVTKTFNRTKPEAVIHTAAFADVDRCETEKQLAWKTNAEATKNIAEASASVDAHITYVSTDYVFDGEKGLYKEEDQTNPISYYGYTKLKGEEFTKEHAAQWCIARPSVLYGWSGTKQNFATWLINTLNQGREANVLTDQYISPTFNTNLAEMLLEISQTKKLGILHTAGATRVNRHDFAVKLAEVFNLNAGLIKRARMNEISWTAKRPKDSSLSIAKARSLLQTKPLTLNEAFEAMKQEENLHPRPISLGRRARKEEDH